jgi:hypothetical protein
MDISKIKFSRLRNGEHAQFFTEVDKLIDEVGASVLTIEPQSALLKMVLAREFEALAIIRKSVLSDELETVDQPRDNTFRGSVDSVKSALNHFDANVKKAASKVMVVLNSFGNVAALPYDEETIAIRKLATELRGTCANEISLLALEPWLTVLETQNDNFATIMKERYSEDAGRTALRMKSIRIEVEGAYKKMLKRIDALIEINGEANYTVFVTELNSRIDKYNNIVARRESSKDDENSKTE